jgi:hypothetical protein
MALIYAFGVVIGNRVLRQPAPDNVVVGYFDVS